ncbi:hypothetical protein [Stenotrophomonas maltophilia]|uniref:hypothetical protein n=1 Tax=Stenotrophomonas maltophilia TaxID=40324 RepID=UPI0015DED36F|nr:hypothetical protein [Stenotrophomonas maltophilia]
MPISIDWHKSRGRSWLLLNTHEWSICLAHFPEPSEVHACRQTSASNHQGPLERCCAILPTYADGNQECWRGVSTGRLKIELYNHGLGH